MENPGFDIIVGNPPYGAELTSHEKAHLKTVRTDTENNNNSAAFFIDIAKNRLMKSDGVLAFIVPKALLFVENWHCLFFVLLGKTRILIDVGEAFKGVKLEQVIFTYDSGYRESFYEARRFVNEAPVGKTLVFYYYPKLFQTWICDVSLEDIQIGLKVRQIGTLMKDISDTKRGLPWQSKLSESGDVRVVGGKQIVRYGTNGIKGFVNFEDLEPLEDSDSLNEKIEFLQQPKVMSQNIIAHITEPKPHIKIMATADQTGEVLSVDTVTNTVLTDRNISPIFIAALLNSELINWYTHKFIFASAVRTMHFDKYYVGKIPIPIVTSAEQQPIIELAEQIMAAKQKNPEVDTSVKEQKIDTLVYSLYELGPEERKLIQSSNECAE